jgi:hypothetical protein
MLLRRTKPLQLWHLSSIERLDVSLRALVRVRRNVLKDLLPNLIPTNRG